MEQNTQEWQGWRRKGIGSSDAPIIMGISKYKTPLQLWEEKLQIADYSKDNSFILDKGHRLEDLAKSHYELIYGCEAPDKLFYHKDFPFLRASLDGYIKEENRAIEIKYTGNGEKWEMATHGEIPPDYYCQMQHQFLVVGCNTIDYVVCNGECIKVVPVKPDIEYIQKMARKLFKFYIKMIMRIKPDYTKADFKKFHFKRDKQLAKEYLENQNEEVFEKMKHPRMLFENRYLFHKRNKVMEELCEKELEKLK